MKQIVEFAALWAAVLVGLLVPACNPPPRGPWLIIYSPTPSATATATPTATSTPYQDHLPPGEMVTITPTPTLLPTIVPGRNQITPPSTLPVTGGSCMTGDPPDCVGFVLTESIGRSITRVDCIGLWVPRLPTPAPTPGAWGLD